METMEVQLLPVRTLRPYPGNARTHSKKQIRQIATSIERFGFTNPVLVSDDNEFVAGHGRVGPPSSWAGTPSRRSGCRI